MTIHCSKCSKPSVIFIRYNGNHLCKHHFNEYVEKRVQKELKQQGKTKNNTNLGIAISGGKDSSTTLYLMHKIFSKRPTVTLSAITVDEGIQGYRDTSIQIAKQHCKKLGIDHHIVSFQQTIGMTMDDIAQRNDAIGECSYCGVFRRFCLNQKTKELGITKLVTGHNLDDTAQSILMNFVHNDLQKLARLGPHTTLQPGLIPRLMPLRMIPENEVMLYAILNDIPFHHAECPYSVRASRGYYRAVIDTLEEQSPGSRHGIIKSYDMIKDFLIKLNQTSDIQTCTVCGEPTSQKTCKTCLLKQRIFK
ncbi:MAG: TIGR00269 family protein [Candidatus Thermoplasmatota archaeon]